MKPAPPKICTPSRRAKRERRRRLVLQHADFRDRVLALLEPPGQQFQHRLRRLDAHRHVDKLVTDHLMLASAACRRSCAPAHRPIASSRQTRAKAVLRGGHVQPLVVEVKHDRPKPGVLLADEVGGGHAAVLEIECRGVGRPPAHLLQRRALQPRRIALDQQQADPARARPASANGDGDDSPRACPEVMKVFEPSTT